MAARFDNSWMLDEYETRDGVWRAAERLLDAVQDFIAESTARQWRL